MTHKGKQVYHTCPQTNPGPVNTHKQPMMKQIQAYRSQYLQKFKSLSVEYQIWIHYTWCDTCYRSLMEYNFKAFASSNIWEIREISPNTIWNKSFSMCLSIFSIFSVERLSKTYVFISRLSDSSTIWLSINPHPSVSCARFTMSYFR